MRRLSENPDGNIVTTVSFFRGAGMNEQSIEEALKALEKPKAVSFAVACCERVIPICEAFYQRNGPELASGLKRFVDIIWESLPPQHPTAADFYSSLAQSCKQMIPDLDDYKGEDAKYAAYAQAGVCAVANALLLCAGMEPEGALKVRCAALEVVDSWLQHTLFTGREMLALSELLRGQPLDVIRHALDRVSEEQEAAKAAHPVFVAELNRQAQDIDDLRKHPFDVELITLLRNRAHLSPAIPTDGGRPLRFPGDARTEPPEG